jgi:hypothetical protein
MVHVETELPDINPGNKSPVARHGAKYAAFISYSRAVDEKLAPALQLGLHRFAKPWNRLRALRVFRDDASLSANPALWSSIKAALTESEHFILMASPSAKQSHWVAQEVEYWCRNRADSPLLVVTEGELVWDRGSVEFDWQKTTALPEGLKGVFNEEPRYIDLRWARSETDISLDHPRFRDCVADLAAALHGRSKDELVGEDVAQHKRTMRLRNQAIAVLLLLLMISVGMAALATRETIVVTRERDMAVPSQCVLEFGCGAVSDHMRILD